MSLKKYINRTSIEYGLFRHEKYLDKVMKSGHTKLSFRVERLQNLGGIYPAREADLENIFLNLMMQKRTNNFVLPASTKTRKVIIKKIFH